MRSQDQPGSAASVEGGDAACWLANVCERCGAFNEVPGLPCWRCGGTTEAADAAGIPGAADSSSAHGPPQPA